MDLAIARKNRHLTACWTIPCNLLRTIIMYQISYRPYVWGPHLKLLRQGHCNGGSCYVSNIFTPPFDFNTSCRNPHHGFSRLCILSDSKPRSCVRSMVKFLSTSMEATSHRNAWDNGSTPFSNSLSSMEQILPWTLRCKSLAEMFKATHANEVEQCTFSQGCCIDSVVSLSRN